MFTNQRYLTIGVQETLPEDIQFELWRMIDNSTDLDYLQVFKIYCKDEKLYVERSQENPEFIEEKEIKSFSGFYPKSTIKVWCIDDSSCSTMLLPEEY